MMPEKPASHDEYIAQFEGPVRQTLEDLRVLIGRLVPDAAEHISYGIASYKLAGKYFLGYGGWKNHCALYLRPSTLERFSKEITGYQTSKGSLHLAPGQPLPESLLTLLINDRLEEHQSLSPGEKH